MSTARDRVGLGVLAVMLFSFLSSTLDATSLPPMTTAQLAQDGDRIVYAKVLGYETAKDASRSWIWTYTRFQILEVIKGNFSEPTLTLRLAGGQVGDEAVIVEGFPRFQAGQELVLFLGPDNAEGYPTVFLQGIYPVEVSPVTGRKVVMATVSGVPLFHASDGSPYLLQPALVGVEDLLFSLRRLSP